MDRRIFLGLSAAAVVTIGGGSAIALDGPAAAASDPALALAQLLETGYVLPDIGKRYAAMLRQKAAAGAYKDIADPAELGQRLTADLLAVSPDRHLRVLPAAMLGPNDRPQPRPADRANPKPPGAPPRVPAGPRPPRRAPIEDAGWIAKDVAYIRFTEFPDDPDTATLCDRFMREHASAKAVIVDCRYNGGGGVVQMNAILPYLFAKPAVLVQMEMVESIAKARGNPFAEDAFMRPAKGAAPGIVRTEHYVVPKTDETRLFGAKVFYLTSARTASAAEHLALAFKHTSRATLIGETTAGANHFGGFEPIGGGLTVFLPVGRTIDPATGKDWEGTGIVPDVAVPSMLALQEALKRAGAIS
ncbi:S41 family peptidase [Sphingomonas asaccharolytica]|uniref:S41 family peptidase n=1 Tax=Sphingomonas asaccharolytica TaxID=40681 RepID=UPI000830A8C1|nr:S41 family peptidase [Sphingomonas asaccharolytica]